MESIAKPLRVLHEEASWFARATETRLLHVRCDGTMRSSALTVLGSMEAHAANKSPYVLLEDAWTRARRGWDMRAERLGQHWEERRRVTTEAGLELGALERPSSNDAFGAFGVLLGLALRALRKPLSGLVVILAPARIEDASLFEGELRELVVRPELAAVAGSSWTTSKLTWPACTRSWAPPRFASSASATRPRSRRTCRR